MPELRARARSPRRQPGPHLPPAGAGPGRPRRGDPRPARRLRRLPRGARERRRLRHVRGPRAVPPALPAARLRHARSRQGSALPRARRRRATSTRRSRSCSRCTPQVPSITGYPVYLGDVDALLEPYAAGVDDETLHQLTAALLGHASTGSLPDAFTHANLGPDDTRVGRTILRARARAAAGRAQPHPARSTPSAPRTTSCSTPCETVFACGKPHFVNHPMMTADLGAGLRRRVLLQLAARRRRLAHAGAAQPRGVRRAPRRRRRRPSSPTTLPAATSSSPPS